jgi:hypothetical protein
LRIIMKLYVCWGLFRTPQPGHPCRNAWDALRAAGHEPEIVRSRGWGALPSWMNRTRGRREVHRLTGRDWVPVMVTGTEVVAGSAAIVAWAADPAHAALKAPATAD